MQHGAVEAPVSMPSERGNPMFQMTTFANLEALVLETGDPVEYEEDEMVLNATKAFNINNSEEGQ